MPPTWLAAAATRGHVLVLVAITDRPSRASWTPRWTGSVSTLLCVPAGRWLASRSAAGQPSASAASAYPGPAVGEAGVRWGGLLQALLRLVSPLLLGLALLAVRNRVKR